MEKRSREQVIDYIIEQARETICKDYKSCNRPLCKAIAELEALDASAENGRGTNQERTLEPDTSHLRSNSEESGGF